MASRIASLQSPLAAIEVSAAEGTWTLTDRRSGVRWGTRPGLTAWGAATIATPGGPRALPLQLSEATAADDAIHCGFRSQDGIPVSLRLSFRLSGDALDVFIRDDAGVVGEVTLLDDGLWCAASEDGAAIVPVRLGLLVPAGGQNAFERSFGTYDYEGCHMAMLGLLKSGSALLATWGDPYISIRLRREVAPQQDPILSAAISLRRTATSFRLRCLGKGDVSSLAEAYIPVAQERGYLVTWDEKLKERPQAERLFGASNVKLWTALARRVGEDLQVKSVDVHWTFDEVAQIAEHIKHDLQLDRVLFHLGGWTKMGYDCQHPDIMPAAPECGGNEGLANCSRRVKALGYLFCLHDNYQDMYRDAPSWHERWIMKGPDGSLMAGGLWLGGRAYLTCSKEAVKLAMRPQNLPEVKRVADPDVYFIDTTYAAGLYECHDPRHPLAKQDDLRWKQAISEYARDLFGLFGSECGREWAIPCSDFFEGLTGVSGTYYHVLKPEELDAVPVPIFEMVFRNCIAMYGKYGYKPEAAAPYVIHHLAIGRPLHYHSLGQHLYWKDQAGVPELPLPESGPDLACFTRAHSGWAEGMHMWDRFMKNTHECLGPLNQISSRTKLARYGFLTADRTVRRTTFANDVTVVVNGSDCPFELETAGYGKAVLPPFGFVVESPEFVAFHATSWNGVEYERPVLFTLRALDDVRLAESRAVRCFHGFGDARLRWRDVIVEVQREEVLWVDGAE
jgi:hypothetical protein